MYAMRIWLIYSCRLSRVDDEKAHLHTSLENSKKEASKEIKALRKECDELASDLEAQAAEMTALRKQMMEGVSEDGDQSKELKLLKRQILQLEEELNAERTSAKRNSLKRKKELKELTEELAIAKQAEVDLRLKCRELQSEMQTIVRSRGNASRTSPMYSRPSPVNKATTNGRTSPRYGSAPLPASHRPVSRSNSVERNTPRSRPSSTERIYSSRPSAPPRSRPSSVERNVRPSPSRPSSRPNSRPSSVERQRPPPPSNNDRLRSPYSDRHQLNSPSGSVSSRHGSISSKNGRTSPSLGPSSRRVPVRPSDSDRSSPVRSFTELDRLKARLRKYVDDEGDTSQNESDARSYRDRPPTRSNMRVTSTGRRSDQESEESEMDDVPLSRKDPDLDRDRPSDSSDANGYDASAEISDIDARLNALQTFLKQAKHAVKGSPR